MTSKFKLMRALGAILAGIGAASAAPGASDFNSGTSISLAPRGTTYNVTFLTPDSSTVWYAGSQADVKWDTTGLPSGIETDLVLGYGSTANQYLNKTLASSFLLSDGMVNFTVPADVVPRNDYVVVLGNGGCSSKMFTIKAPSPAPAPALSTNIPVSHKDRVYTADQWSNTVTVTDPVDNQLLGVIRLGDTIPNNLSPLYRNQTLVHGMGFSPDHRTLLVVSIITNSVAFIDTATNVVKHIAYVGRAPHESFFTPDGKEVWVTVRGENYISVIDPITYVEKTRIIVPDGPGMQIFSPDGKYGYVCSSFYPETVVISVADHQIVGRVRQASPFCPNIAPTPDGKQVWFTLKDIGATQVFDGRPPFSLLKTLNTGPITNHVNTVENANGTFAYVTIGGLNEVQVFRTDDFSQVATIPVGALPHGIWPSGDGTRIFVGLEHGARLVEIDTLTNKVVSTSPIGQGCQAIVYVPDAVPTGNGTQGLQQLGIAANVTHLSLVQPPTMNASQASTAGNWSTGGNWSTPTSVSLFDQGTVQVLQAAVTGLTPNHTYVLALSQNQNGTGTLEPLQPFVANPAGAAIVNSVGMIRQLLQGEYGLPRRYLTVVPGTAQQYGAPVLIQG